MKTCIAYCIFSLTGEIKNRRQPLKFRKRWPAHGSEPAAHFLFADEPSRELSTLLRPSAEGLQRTEDKGEPSQDVSQSFKVPGPHTT